MALPKLPKIVLVNPPPFRRAEEWDTPSYPHLGLAYLASSLRHRGYDDCVVVDAKLQRLSLEETVSAVLALGPHVVGLTGLTNDMEQVASVAHELKRRNEDLSLVLGGHHASILPEQSLREIPEIDYVVINEGERVLPALLGALTGDSRPHFSIPNLCYRRGGHAVRTDRADWIADLDALPPPAWDLSPYTEEVPVLTARGCPFGCRFCRPFGRRVRWRSVENVLAEVQSVLESRRPKRLHFYDETFGIDKKRTLALLEGLTQMGVAERATWLAHTRINTCSEALLTRMYEAGCRNVGFGIEAASESILGDKKVDPKKAQALIAHGRKLGMTVRAFFILGHPDEALWDMCRTIQLATKLNPTIPIFGVMVPYPGTEIHELAKAGRAGYALTARTWNDYNKQIGDAVRFTRVGNLTVEFLRMFAYPYFYLYRLRIADFLKLFAINWRLVLAVFANLPKRNRTRR